jgi:hypothetical protein
MLNRADMGSPGFSPFSYGYVTSSRTVQPAPVSAS